MQGFPSIYVFSSKVFYEYYIYNGAYCLLGAICFAIYIYADFSSYSDIARGISQILGIDVGKNFNNPYLSRSLSEFWNRWHISLYSWFLENIYIPLGGSKKGKLRKYFNILVVFFISGLWHGANWHFVIWGIINGVLLILGDITYDMRISLYKKINIFKKHWFVWGQRLIVFALIIFTWIFFAVGCSDAFKYISIISNIRLEMFFDPDIFTLLGTEVDIYITIFSTILFIVVQFFRQNKFLLFSKFNNFPVLVQLLIISIFLSLCILNMLYTGSSVNSQYLYYQF